MSTHTLPTLFVPHGAGPCFFMDWRPADAWADMESFLCAVLKPLDARPRAVLVISAHWEAPEFTVNVQGTPPLLFDYYGFPPHTYELEYPAPGAPAIAERVRGLLTGAGFAAATEADRGLDHGVFIPMMLMAPEADVPIVQLSLKQGLDPAEHIAVGRALAPLRREGVLIVGSGMSYHNMRGYHFDDSALNPDSVHFDEWLTEAVAQPPTEREQRLVDWVSAPSGRASHPREEHLLPLHVVAGAAGEDAGQQVFHGRVIGSMQSAYQFGS